MIHEIFPNVLDNQYHPVEITKESRVCIFYKGQFFLKEEDGVITIPRFGDLKENDLTFSYLFSIDEDLYFCANVFSDAQKEQAEQALEGEGCTWAAWRMLRDVKPKTEAFAAMTAIHIINWYGSVQYCGRCGSKAEHDKRERMMRCPSCGNMMFPKISPAVLAAVTDGEKLLLTKYSNVTQANAYALVAGFVEIGETGEECVAREVMEETGIRVKNVKYYDSQPWGYAGNLMMAYTAELDGSPEITLDRNELKEAVWLTPEEVPEIEDYSSLTREMIRRFRKGELFSWQKAE